MSLLTVLIGLHGGVAALDIIYIGASEKYVPYNCKLRAHNYYGPWECEIDRLGCDAYIIISMNL